MLTHSLMYCIFAFFFQTIAEKKGITNAQLSIAWVSSLGSNIVPIPGSSKPSRVTENLGAGKIVLTDEEKEEIDAVLKKHTVRGGRYFGGEDEKVLWG